MIFTGLSNNWALLQRVNAIEKYLKENPIVPYAKASVAGEGTDTFVFDKSQLSVVNGGGLMVGDLIICPDVTLWQVISIADSGEVTARYLVNFKGEQGIQGETALVYADIAQTGTVPSVNGYLLLDSFKFNRVPKIGEHVIVIFKRIGVGADETQINFISYCRIDSQQSNDWKGIIEKFVNIDGPQGPQGQACELYRHRIKIDHSGTILVEFDIYNRSATQFNYTTLKNYLNGKIYNAVGYTAAPPTFDTAVKKVRNLSGTITAVNNVNQSVKIEEVNTTVTDTVEEI